MALTTLWQLLHARSRIVEITRVPALAPAAPHAAATRRAIDGGQSHASAPWLRLPHPACSRAALAIACRSVATARRNRPHPACSRAALAMGSALPSALAHGHAAIADVPAGWPAGHGIRPAFGPSTSSATTATL